MYINKNENFHPTNYFDSLHTPCFGSCLLDHSSNLKLLFIASMVSLVSNYFQSCKITVPWFVGS